MDNDSYCINFKPILVLKSINLFDLDLAYSFTDALLELDYLIFAKTMENRVLLLTAEEVSDILEWSKIPQRLLISHTAKGDLWLFQNTFECISILPYMNRKNLKDKADINLSIFLSKYFSEYFNLYLYALFILAFRYAKTIFNDLEKVIASRVSFPKVLLHLAKNIGKALSRNISNSSCSNALDSDYVKRVNDIEKALDSSEVIYVLPQTGMGVYRIKHLINTIDLIIQHFGNCKKKDVVIYLNEDIRFDIGNIYKGRDCIYPFKRLILRFSKYPSKYSILCFPKELSKGVEKGKKALIFLMQDWNKEILIKCMKYIIDYHGDNLLGLIIIPEAYYYPIEGNRVITTYGGFLGKLARKQINAKKKRELILKILSLKSAFIKGCDVKEICGGLYEC